MRILCLFQNGLLADEMNNFLSNDPGNVIRKGEIQIQVHWSDVRFPHVSGSGIKL